MALSSQQLQDLFRGISSGNQSAFIQDTPGMDENTRNQWVNSYGNGGTNWGDYLQWYNQNKNILNSTPASANMGGANSGQTITTPGTNAASGFMANPTNGSWNVNGKYGDGSGGGTTTTYPTQSLTMPTQGFLNNPTGFGGMNTFNNGARPSAGIPATFTNGGVPVSTTRTPGINSVGPGGSAPQLNEAPMAPGFTPNPVNSTTRPNTPAPQVGPPTGGSQMTRPKSFSFVAPGWGNNINWRMGR